MALTYGADAIYLAGQEFGMRTASANFSNEQLAKAVQKTMRKMFLYFFNMQYIASE